MNLTQRLEALISESAGDLAGGRIDFYFYRLLDLTREMAKRIEALEQSLDSDAQAKGYAHTIFHR